MPGYAHSVRLPYEIMGRLNGRAMRRDHPGERFGEYEFNHLVALSIGGGPADHRNLWLEPRSGRWSADAKDELEYALWIDVCRRSLPPAYSAQTFVPGGGTHRAVPRMPLPASSCDRSEARPQIVPLRSAINALPAVGVMLATALFIIGCMGLHHGRASVRDCRVCRYCPGAAAGPVEPRPPVLNPLSRLLT